MNNIVKTIEHNGMMSGRRTIEIHQYGNRTFKALVIPHNVYDNTPYWIPVVFTSAEDAEEYLTQI